MKKREEIKDIIFRNREYFFETEEYINREVEFKEKINSSLITVISGIRRSGKSVLLKIIKDYLLEEKKINKNSIYYLDFNDYGLTDYSVNDLGKLFEIYFEEFFSKNKYIFLDEVQEIKNWHKLVLNFHKKGYKVIITGSNGNLLSKEIGTYLTGRINTLSLFPFSFREYLKIKNKKIDYKKKSQEKLIPLKNSFKDYLQQGGFPLVLKENNKKILKDYYENIINRDVIVRNNIKNTKNIKELSYYLVTNFTNISSYNSLKNSINIKSLSSLKNYLDFLRDSYLILDLKKHDFSIKKQVSNPRKYYIIDTGFISQIAYNFSKNLGRFLENCVFLELKRNANEIFYYSGKKECDFIVQDYSKVINSIQVTWELNENNKNRELEGLYEAMEKFNLKEGLILTFDQTDKINYKDKMVLVKPVWRWLLEK